MGVWVSVVMCHGMYLPTSLCSSEQSISTPRTEAGSASSVKASHFVEYYVITLHLLRYVVDLLLIVLSYRSHVYLTVIP
jgi:hypothetical protein